MDGTQPLNDVLLEVTDLKMHFAIQHGFLHRSVGTVKAVDGVSFSIRKGETLGLVGESGSGKTTVARCIMRILAPTEGHIHYQKDHGQIVDLATMDSAALMPYRREIRMIFQDPYSSLNPRLTLLQIVGEPLKVNRLSSGKDLEARVAELLRVVGLRPEYMRRYPHAFSGGERQRIGIARALATNPRLVVADEAVSALDLSVRAQVLNLLQDLQRDYDLTYLFIAHDLSVVEHICNRVAVMYVGRLVELACTDALYAAPRHPYTESLLAAVPKPDPRLRDASRSVLPEDSIADPACLPSGCHFHPRCPRATTICMQEQPALRDLGDAHFVACHHA